MSVITRSRKSSVLGGIALAGAAALVLAGCAAGTSSEPTESEVEARDLTLKIGTILPVTGSLSFLGPPEEAGVGLAASDINEVAEETGLTMDDIVWGDSGDTDNKAYATTIQTLISEGVSAAIGAASSGVTKLFLDDAVAAGIITFSPANTSLDFTTWDDNDLYWRTAPSDKLQGEVLANLVAEDAHSNVAVLYLNDSYGTGLNDVFQENFTGTGGTIVEEQSYNTGDTTFDAQISAILASNPDAVVLITFDEIYTIGPALLAAGYPAEDLYFVDGNLKNFSADDKWPADVSLEGAKGTTPAGPSTPEDFQTRLNDWWVADGNSELTDFAYANESYDAVILLALASLAANSTDAADIAGKLQEVSGGSGDGEKCESYADCADIILGGGVADYDGYSGPIGFDEVGDPQEATVGIFQYQADNSFSRIDL
ncbi:branched-chain amino acid transport system substrate-binding protein [Microbacterium terrae]|uniref:Leucine-, isoleucine-, valine-, threonine-, and alanine-binding protein n=1 Tax=Microbacterium terrae TaxID=69369 RepID=A0A0M2H3E0_9MICO|nr:ABC transporter substrate-binding protein [Microbacterium terrae]KJL40942.1 Leucine-, isoleucine-, valine-, threonine-, and alanine-binding protein precursor [Microbacterium terrae]MBP1078231.1 branched-chain amino acid transport system substrate-binding protein [Microbacterium terrae]GLJ97710.1 branched-chain amino acid ABC transporter substrate-binding protein [Microbacterium terrae]